MLGSDTFPDFMPLVDIDMATYNLRMGLAPLTGPMNAEKLCPKLGRINNATVCQASKLFTEIDLNSDIYILEAEAHHIMTKCFDILTQKHGSRHVAFWNSYRRDGRDESPLYDACPRFFADISAQAATGIAPAHLSSFLTAYFRLALLEYIPANSSLLYSLDSRVRKRFEYEPHATYLATNRRYDRNIYAVVPIGAAKIALDRSGAIRAVWKVWKELVEMLVHMCCYTHYMRSERTV